MNTNKILKKAGVEPDEPIFSITTEEAIQSLLETIKEYCPNLRIDRMKPEDIKTLLNSYGDCIIKYHPDNHHQERATLLRNFEMLKRYGLKDEDYEIVDFC